MKTQKMTASFYPTELSEMLLAFKAACTPFGSLGGDQGESGGAWGHLCDQELLLAGVTRYMNGDVSAAGDIVLGVRANGGNHHGEQNAGDYKAEVQFCVGRLTFVTPTSGTKISLSRRAREHIIVEVDFGQYPSENRAFAIRDASPEISWREETVEEEAVATA
jgi:hypothetical protein